jgi:TRAP-type transport system periplasmic protein
MRNRCLAAATALVAFIGVGCSGPTDKSGGQVSPTTVVLASNDGSNAAGGLARFIELVEEGSDGRLKIEVTSDWRDKGEQRVLEDVAAGKAELGWSGTRAFDTIGVDTFRPLHAPFLIRSYPAQQAVVESNVPQQMLAGLEGSGLTGLALLADELRFPAGAEGPLLDPADFDELPFGTMPSTVQSAAMTALGARVKAIATPHSPATDGLEGLETMWRTYVGANQRSIMPFVTPNAVLWPRTTVIVANSQALDDLTSQERDVIIQAATEAARWSAEHADDDVEVAKAEACREGALIALASTSQLAALVRASRPAYAAIRADKEQASLLDEIEALVRGANDTETVAVPDACAYQPGDEERLAVRVLPEPLTGPGRLGQLPAGTYRYTLTEGEISSAIDLGPDFAEANAGVWTWTLGKGKWSYLLRPSAQEVPEGFAGNTCEGYYDVHGSQVDFTTVTVYASGDCASKTWKATWRYTGNGLQMNVTTDAHDLDYLFGAKRWERIE